MKALIKTILFVLVLTITGVVGGAYIIPPVAQVERAIQIKAPPTTVYGIASDLRRFNDWSPWYGIDPKADYRFEGPDQGVGQKMSWSSTNPEVGRGSQTIVEADPDRKVAIDIDFGGMGKARSTLLISELDDGTAVVWRFETPVEGVMERWMSLMFDRWIGADYVKGLRQLKTIAEEGAARP